MAYTNAISSYRETKVKTASQGQLIIMLYEEAVRQLDRALEFLALNAGENKDPSNIEKISKSILKVQEIITELNASLDFEQGGDIAQSLFSLYTWFNRELLEANIDQDIRRIRLVRSQINDLKNAWTEVVAKTGAESASKAALGVNIAG
ncbi:MAG: flagellar export chaperone FliS [Treponema sp.]|nr:flagellar export chaperone FliS [Treponema sp.]